MKKVLHIKNKRVMGNYRGFYLTCIILLFAVNGVLAGSAPPCASLPIVEDPALPGDQNEHPCQDNVPVFVVDLRGVPDSLWDTRNFIGMNIPTIGGTDLLGINAPIDGVGIRRHGDKDKPCETCCSSNTQNPDNESCLGVILYLDDNASGMAFEIVSGATPGSGVLGYTFAYPYAAPAGCSPEYPADGTEICLTGGGPFYINFCKPGANPNHFTIKSIPKPDVSPTDVVSEACEGKVWASGYDPVTIQWTPIPTGNVQADSAVFTWMFSNSQHTVPTNGAMVDTIFVSIDSMTAVLAPAWLPDSVLFEVCGSPFGACDSLVICDTTMVRFVSNLEVSVFPKDPAICFGESFVTLYGSGANGDPPYIYNWYKDGDSIPIYTGIGVDSTIDVYGTGAGQYIITVTDQQGCSSNEDTSNVTVYPSPIDINVGNDTISCSNDSCVQMNASVEIAGGIYWLDGLVTGTFSVNDSTDSLGTLTTIYCPSAAEVTAGSVQLIAKTTENRTCPEVYDTLILAFDKAPIVDAGPPDTVCANNLVMTHAGTYQNTTGAIWSGGTGSYSTFVQDSIADYTLSTTDTVGGSITKFWTSTGHSVYCAAAIDSMVISVIQSPIVSAGPDDTTCNNNYNVVLAASSSTGSGLWHNVNGDNSGFSNVADSNATYTPTTADSALGIATLVWESTNNGLYCFVETDTMQLVINTAATATAPADIFVCHNNADFTVTGITTPGGQSVVWHTNMPGSFASNDSLSYTITYQPNTGAITPPDSFDLAFCVPNPGVGCVQECDTMKVNVTPSPVVNACNGCGPFDYEFLCAGNCLNLNGAFTNQAFFPGSSTEWDMLYIFGSVPHPNPSAGISDLTNLTSGYCPSSIEIPVLPDKTVEIVKFILTPVNVGNCLVVPDTAQLTIYPAPLLEAGSNREVCVNNSTTISLSATANYGPTGQTSPPSWDDAGATGTFSPTNTLATTYTLPANPSVGDTVNAKICVYRQAISSICPVVCDSLDITFVPAPTANAGLDQSVCANSPLTTLTGDTTSGGAGGALSFAWTNLYGTAGTFSPVAANTLSVDYTPDASQIAVAAGQVPLPPADSTWCLKFEVSDVSSFCSPVSDTVCIDATPSPYVEAGPNDTVCDNNRPLTLTGNITGGATQGVWSGGTGVFLPNSATLTNVGYTPVTPDSVTLMLCSTNGAVLNNCAEECDSMKIFVTPAPTVSAGPDDTSCVNNANVTLAGSFDATVSNGIVWRNFGGSFSPPGDSTNTAGLYQPSLAEIGVGNTSTNLIISTTGSGLCNEITDTMTIFFEPSPVVSAGNDVNSCANNPVATISGSFSNALGVLWTTTSTDVTINNATSPITSVSWNSGFPTAGDSVVVCLTTTGNGTCNPVQDCMTIHYTPAPTISAGPADTSCSNRTQLCLSASMTLSTTLIWSNNDPAGTFVGGSKTSDTVCYIPTTAEITAGSILFVVTTTDTGNCLSVSDSVTLRILQAPALTTNIADSICIDALPIDLSASLTQDPDDPTVYGVVWSGVDPGETFSPVNNLNSTYNPDPTNLPQDSTPIMYNPICITTTGGSFCNNVSTCDSFTVMPVPTVTVGGNITVCTDASTVSLSATTVNVDGGTWSNGSGATGSYTTSTSNPSVYNINLPGDSAGGDAIIIRYCGDNPSYSGCGVYCDSLEITFQTQPAAIVSAPSTVCDNDYPISITATGSGVGTWTTTNDPAATFANNRSISTTVTPTANNLIDGYIVVTYTTDALGVCPSFDDRDTINLLPGPIVLAGPDRTLCSDVDSIHLAGSISNAGGTGFWNVILGETVGTFGNGFSTITPNDYTFHSDNYPASADPFKLTHIVLCNDDVTFCPQECDTVIITLTPAVKIDAGVDRTICGDQDTILLQAFVETATGGQWVTSSGCNGPTAAFSDVNILNPVYTWCLGDTSGPADSLILTITSTGNGTCAPVSDFMVLHVTPVPTISAGPNDTICFDEPFYTLNGTVTVASQGIWTTNSTGPGTFDNGGVFSATTAPINYYHHLADSNQTIEMYLNTQGAGQCKNIADTMLLTVLPTPLVTVPANTTACFDAGSFTITGASILNSTTGTWSSNGSGSFNGTENTIDGAVYTFGAADTNAIIVFKLVSTDNGTCFPDSATFTLTISPSIIVDAGPAQALCATSDTIQLSGIVLNAGGGTWSTLPTGGSFIDNIDLATQYVASPTDTANRRAVIYLDSRLEGQCLPRRDSVIISFQPQPLVSAGPNDTVCADTSGYTLAGLVTNATGGHWTSSGDSNFFVNADTLNATFVPSVNDTIQANQPISLILTTTGNGLCAAVSDTMELTITAIPFINVAAFDTVCADIDSVQLSATFGVATGVVWSTSGTGTISDSSQANTSYFLSTTGIANDTLVGDIRFFVTTTGNGLCGAYSKQMDLHITPAPLMNPGPDRTICRDLSTVTMNGSVSFGSGVWSSSDVAGAFSDSSNLAAIYTHNTSNPTTPDSITLTLTNINVGTCKQISDSILLIVTPIPIMNAGGVDTVCADSSTIQLSGTFANTGGGIWSSSTGTIFSPSATDTNPLYQFDSLDYVAGSVTLNWTSTNFGTCNPVTDSLVVTINPAPTVDAGPPQRICADALSTNMAGTVTVASGGIWSTAGQGSFTTPTSLTSIYTADSAGIAVLTLKTTGNGLCKAVSDNVVITIDPKPFIFAGPTQTLCKSVSSVTMAGSITNATGIVWTAKGTGTWQGGNNTSLNSVYLPSALDKSVGTIQIIGTTTDTITNCMSVSDTVTIIFSPLPTVDAGSATACFDAAGIQLIATRQNANGVVWSTNGAGGGTEFTATGTDTTYFTPNAANIPGTIKVFIRTVGSGGCPPAYDTIQVQIRPDPIIEAGDDQVVCIDEDTVCIGTNADTTDYNGPLVWSSTGGGPFVDATSMNTCYALSAVDVVRDSAVLYLCTANNGLCPTVCDSIIAYITPAPAVYAGANLTICADEPTVCLTGDTVNSVPSGLSWTTDGDGSWNDSTLLDPCYMPGPVDSTSADGSVQLTLCTTGNGRCNTYCDNRTLFITPRPTFTLPPADTYCSDIGSYIISVSDLLVATSGHWTYSGAPDSISSAYGDNSLTYQTYFSAADKITSDLVYTFCADIGNGRCQVYCDTFNLKLTPAPILDIGDSAICASDDSVLMIATYTVAGGVEWSTNGDGTFSDDMADSSYYFFGANDKLTKTVMLIAETRDAGTCSIIYDTMIVNYSPPYSVSAGGDQTVCSDSAAILLDGSHNAAVDSVVWTTSGDGTFTTPLPMLPENDTTASYVLGTTDMNSSVIQLVLTTAVGSLCPEISDTMNIFIYKAPVVTASATNACASPGNAVDLTGRIDTNGVPGFTGTWTTAGGGLFDGNTNPTSTVLPNTDYTPAGVDLVTETFLLTLTSDPYRQCKIYSDTFRVTLIPVPTVTTVDTVICKDADQIDLSAYTFSDTTTRVTWSGGNGTFSVGDIGAGIDSIYKSDSTFMTYTFNHPADTNGVDSLVLFVTNQGGSCSPVTDSIIIRFTPAPKVYATPAVTCVNFGNINLTGIVLNAGGGTWSHNGGGTFQFDSDTLINVYQPVGSDTVGTADSVQFFLQTRLEGGCKTYIDTAVVYFTPPPVLNPGNDTSVCADVLCVPLNNISVDTVASAGAFWTSDLGGTFTPDSTTLSGGYYCFPNNLINGNDTTVTLILTTYGSSPCPEIWDTVFLNITHPPVVTADTVMTVCADASGITVSVITNDIPDSVSWVVVNGTGTFVDPNADTTVYNHTQADIDNGFVLLSYESYDFAGCVPIIDTILVNITPVPTVNIIADEICIDNPVVTLTSIVTHNNISTPNDAVWSSSTQGANGFTNGAGNTDFYTLDTAAGDIPGATVILTLTTTKNGLCMAYKDSVILNIIPKPFANAGPNQAICGDQDTIFLNGIVTTANSIWAHRDSTTTGFDNPNSDTTFYIMSPADSANGVVLYLRTTFDNRGCKPGLDSIIVSTTNPPVIDAGIPDTACYESSPGVPGFISLQGSIQFDVPGAGVYWSGGTGTFESNTPGLGITDTIVNYYFDPVDSCGPMTLYLTSTGTGNCNAVTDSVEIFVRCIPSLSANADTTVCGDVDSVQVSVIADNGLGSASVIWTTSGSGAFSDSSLATTQYIPHSQDILDSVVVLTPSSTNNECLTYTESFRMYFSEVPTVDAGLPEDVCSCSGDSIYLTGTVTVANAFAWTTDGSGSFVDSSVLNAVYVPSCPGDSATTVNMILTASDTVTGCKSYVDTVQITFEPAVVVSAGGPFDTVCADIGTIQLDGSVLVATGGLWSTLDGDPNMFNPIPPNRDTVDYTLTAADTTRGSVSFVLASTGNGNCLTVFDTITVIINPAPQVIAGIKDTICADAMVYGLAGTVFVTNSGFWNSTGDGSWNPDSLTLVTDYVLGVNDASVLTGTTNQIILTLTSSNNGLCNPVSDFITLDITEVPVVDAGFDRTVCQDKSTVDFSIQNAIIFGATTTGIWSTTNGDGQLDTDSTYGGFTTYILGTGDTAMGTTGDSIEFILTSTNNGGCNPVSDTMYVHVLPRPTVTVNNTLNLINDTVTICADQDTVSFIGTVTNTPTQIWSSTSPIGCSNCGFSQNDATSLVPLFTVDPSALPVDGGSPTYVGITLTTAGNSNGCDEVSDALILEITARPTVNITAPDTVCADIGTFSVSGNIQIATGAVWSTSDVTASYGNTVSLNTTYTLGTNDISFGQANLLLTTTGSGQCNEVFENHNVIVTPRPEIDAGPDLVICRDFGSFTISGATSNSVVKAVRWTTLEGNNANFSDRYTLNPTYVLASTDMPAIGATTSTFLTFILESTNVGDCKNIIDTMRVEIEPIPQVSLFTGDICADLNGLDISSTYINSTGIIWSSNDGTFGNNAAPMTDFVPNANVKPGTATVTVCSDGNGTCRTYCDSMDIIITDLPYPDAGPTQLICRNSATQLTGIDNLGTGDVLTWYDNSSTALGTGAIYNVGSVPGPTFYIFGIVDINGCERRDTMYIDVVDPPTLDMDSLYCFEDNLIISAGVDAGTIPPVPYQGSWQWYFEGSPLTGKVDTTLQVIEPGVHSITWTAGSCRTGDSTIVAPQPIVEGVDVTVCAFDTDVPLNATTGFVNYDWAEVGGLGQTGNGNPILVNGIGSDTVDQVFIVTVTDDLGCKGDDYVYLYEYQKPLIDIDPGLTCSGTPADLIGTPSNDSAIGNTDSATFTWVFEGNSGGTAGSTWFGLSLDSASHRWEGLLDSGWYKLTYGIDECIVSDSVFLPFHPLPSTDAQDSAVFCVESDGSAILDGGYSSGSYNWYDEDMTELGITDQFAEVFAEMTYFVDIIDSNGCISLDSVYVEERCPPRCHLPTAFSPNGEPCDPTCTEDDGVTCPDNCFYVFCKHQKDFKLTVFNRWGEIIFYSVNKNDVWDGTYLGVDMPSGVYPWTMEYNAAEEEYDRPKYVSGKVLIVR